MELIRGNVVLKFTEEDVKTLDKAIIMLDDVKDIYDKLDYEDYDMEDLEEYRMAFDDTHIRELRFFSDYIKTNSYSITMYERG